MYTIIVCPKCEHVNTVKDRPERTECKKCGKSHQFSKLRHYFQHEDRRQAVQARAKIHAKLSGKEDAYERAFENGALREVDGGNLNDKEVLEAAGIDAGEVEEAGRRALSGEGGSTSQSDIMLEAVRDTDVDSVRDIVQYAEDRGISEDKAVSILQKMQENQSTAAELVGIHDPGGVLDSGTTVARSSSDRTDDTDGTAEQSSTKSSSGRSGSSSSQRQILIDAIKQQDSPDLDDVLEYAEDRGIDRERAGQIVSKMRTASEITMSSDGSFRHL